MNQLTEYYKIIQRFTSLYAGEGDDELARQAVDAITPLAEKGNTKAQYMLGRYYLWGCHNQCDNQKAIYWFEKAAAKGSDKAAEALADLYRYDFVDDEMISAQAKKDFGHKWHYRWIEILEAKAAKGVASAAQALMKLYVYDRPADIDREEGVKIACKWHDRWVEILRARADKGDMATKKRLADILFWGTGAPDELLDFTEYEDIAADKDSAAELYAEVANSEQDAEAWFNLGELYCRKVTDKAYLKSLDCYMKAAELGYKAAYHCIGGAYFDGRGVEKDWGKAREWYQKGAEAGDVMSRLQLADCYKRGMGGDKDYAEAMKLYRQIASRKNIYGKYNHEVSVAQYEIGNMYMKGLGVETDIRQAFDWIRLAAENGNIAAENALNNKKFRDFKR
ncbi:MAG: hypothetical protein K2N21_05800 [Rikenellaceae bacterium]|nr:hypothetical protein [Rikenellaceae bacterium]